MGLHSSTRSQSSSADARNHIASKSSTESTVRVWKVLEDLSAQAWKQVPAQIPDVWVLVRPSSFAGERFSQRGGIPPFSSNESATSILRNPEPLSRTPSAASLDALVEVNMNSHRGYLKTAPNNQDLVKMGKITLEQFKPLTDTLSCALSQCCCSHLVQ